MNSDLPQKLDYSAPVTNHGEKWWQSTGLHHVVLFLIIAFMAMAALFGILVFVLHRVIEREDGWHSLSSQESIKRFAETQNNLFGGEIVSPVGGDAWVCDHEGSWSGFLRIRLNSADYANLQSAWNRLASEADKNFKVTVGMGGPHSPKMADMPGWDSLLSIKSPWIYLRRHKDALLNFTIECKYDANAGILYVCPLTGLPLDSKRGR